jgi:hypothetical protein
MSGSSTPTRRPSEGPHSAQIARPPHDGVGSHRLEPDHSLLGHRLDAVIADTSVKKCESRHMQEAQFIVKSTKI